MEYFTKEEFETLHLFAKEKYDKTSDEDKRRYQTLRTLYNKVGEWAKLVQNQFYPDGIVKYVRNPLNNNGTSFMEYQWAQIYPSKEDAENTWLAFTVAVTSDEAFEIKIDTVKLNDKDELRKRYFEYRGDYGNSSRIVKIIPYQEALQHDWDWLVKTTGEYFKEINTHFEILRTWRSNNDLENYSASSSSKNSTDINKFPKNLILFGPPGTGKTYYLKQLFQDFTTSPESQTEEQFHRNLVADKTWWEILAICLYEKKKTKVPELLRHPLIIAKFALSEIQHPSQRIWSTLQIHTVDDCENVKLIANRRHGVSIFYKESDSTWRLDNISAFEEEFVELVDLFVEYKAGPEQGQIVKRYSFTTFHQSLSYEDFIEGIKPKMNELDEGEQEGDIGYYIEKGIFFQSCEQAAQLAGYQNLRDCLSDDEASRKEKFLKIKNDPKKQYCIFIDEINRANISSVFGELITLIEDDKRLGSENEIIIDKMPYSKKPFGIPPNLYLIGTMNTADRSVEALDSALRRRFEFKEMLPQPELLENKMANIDLDKMLTAINARIEKLLDKDHTIGHAYFMGLENSENPTLELKGIFQNKILPLLQEHFFGDIGRISLIIGEGFFDRESGDIPFMNGWYDASEYTEEKVIRMKNVTQMDEGIFTELIQKIYQ